MASRLMFMEKTPRVRGTTEMRGPSHSFLAPELLEEVLSAAAIDGLKFSGGSSSLMPRNLLRDLIRRAHRHGIYVSSGGWSEHMLDRGRSSFKEYIRECKDLGFDMIEYDTFSTSNRVSEDDFLFLTRLVKSEGLKAKPSLYVSDEDADSFVRKAERLMNAGADVIMIESNGEVDKVAPWQTNVIAKLIERLGVECLMFEAVQPGTMEWFIRNYGANVNLFVDHSNLVELEDLRCEKRGGYRCRLLL